MLGLYGVLFSIFISWVLASFIKFCIDDAQGQPKSFIEELYRTGGMPSAHSAIVTSLVVGIYFYEGLSTSFIVSLVLAAITIRDSFGVRLSVGKQAELLNKLAAHDHIREKTKVVLGHTILQSLAGVILGVVVTFANGFLIGG